MAGVAVSLQGMDPNDFGLAVGEMTWALPATEGQPVGRAVVGLGVAGRAHERFHL